MGTSHSRPRAQAPGSRLQPPASGTRRDKCLLLKPPHLGDCFVLFCRGAQAGEFNPFRVNHQGICKTKPDFSEASRRSSG